MNKKAQSGVPSDPAEFILWALGLIVLLVIIGGVFNVLSNIGCEDERNQINQLKTDLSICQSQIQNQTELTLELNSQCNQKINESITECNDDLQININIVKNYKAWFVIYHITIALSVILVLNLFKGFLRFEINVKNRKLKIFFKGIRFVWTGVRWVLFATFSLLIIFCLLVLLFPQWFF